MIKMLTVLFTVSIVAGLSSLPRLTYYYDASAINANSVPATIQRALMDIEGEWRAVIYVNVLGDGRPESYLPGGFYGYNANFRRVFERYVHVNPNFNLEYVFYYADPAGEGGALASDHLEERARDFARQHRLDFNSFLTWDEVNNHAGILIHPSRPHYVLYGNGQRAVVRTFPDMIDRPLEADFGAR